MIPLRAESSTVSLPPRERALAKRRAKAIKLGLSPLVASKSPAKGTQKRAKAPAPPPTLAATRQRRAAADVAYIDRPDGYHIKRIVRRVTPGPPPPVPYLPGEEDLPHSDAESDDSDATELQVVNSHDLGQHGATFDIGLEAEETPTELDTDLVDYDAEGEDDEDVQMQDIPQAGYSFSAPAPMHVGAFGSTASTEATSSARPANPFANANDDDIQVLFGGLDNLHFGDGPATTDGDNFPGFIHAHSHSIPDRLVAHARYLVGNIGNELQYGAQGSNHWEPFAMPRLNATVDNPQAGPSGLASINHSTGPLPGHSTPLPLVNGLPPLNRVATPAPWIVVPEPQAPIAPRPATPLPRSQSVPLPPAHNATRYILASQTGAPTSPPFLLRTPGSTRPRPRLSTRERVYQARAEARSPHLPIPPPTFPANVDNPRARSPLDHDDSLPFGVTALRRSLNLPDHLDGSGYNTDDAISEGEERRLDPNASRPSTPVALEDTDIGLNEDSPVQVTQARCRASRFLNVRRLVPHHTPRHIPTVLDLRANARKLFNLHRRRHRGRYSNVAPETSRRNRSVLRSGALTPDQQTVASPMEFSVLKDVICDNPWPEDRDVYLRAAQHVRKRWKYN